MKDGFKKTAIRMPSKMWDELTVVSTKYGISNNSMMVLLIGQMLENERKKTEALSPAGIGKIMSELGINAEQLSLFNKG